MAVQIKINGVDKSNNIDPNSVSLQRAMTSQVDTLSFNVIRPGGAVGGGFKPEANDTIEIVEDGNTIFGGQIIQIDETVEADNVETFNCLMKDYSFDMDRHLVIAIYENETVDDIILDIKTRFLGVDYDISNVNCSILVNYIAFNYELPSKVFQQLAELTGYDWYVNELKEIYFFEKTSQTAPFNLEDASDPTTDGNYFYNTLKISNDIKSLRNSIIVRGGEYLGSQISEKQIADGIKTTFQQTYKYSDVFVKINGGANLNVGIDNIDDPTLFDCLYNFNEKSIIFLDADKPADTDEVEVGGLPHIPVIIKLRDVASITEFGEFEYKIIDKSINSREGARERARAEIKQYGDTISDGSFETNKTGLDVGQRINVNSVIRGIDRDYIISRISSKMPNGTEFRHSVTLMTTQTYGVIEFFQKLLMDKDKEIVINQDEVLDFITAFEDSMSFTDSIDSITNTTGPYYYDDAGAKWNFATWT